MQPLRERAVTLPNELDFSTILASSVHDMKNSISMMLGTLEQLTAECGPTCGAGDKINQLRYQGQRLNGDLVQMLSIYKIENHQYTTNVDEHDVREFLLECVDTHAPLLTPRGIEIESDCATGLVGYFDREMVAGVINNVVNNAYKYSKSRIRISAETRDGFLAVHVADNGRGYPQAMLRDSRDGAGPINFRTGSTSLGLYFASLIAHMHENRGRRGYVRLSNDGIDAGGCFSIYLP
jgi:K+-sensing histidine kinase KdpD